MSVFNKAIARATALITNIKVSRAQAAIDTYIQVADIRMSMGMAVVGEGYRRLATVALNKTAEDSRPLASLLVALDGVAKHYGPALTAEMDALVANLDALDTDPAVVLALGRFKAAVEALKGDAP